MRNGLKKSIALLLAVLMFLAVLPAIAGVTYSNPVVPGVRSIISPTEPTITYVFMKGETVIGRQIVKEGDVLLEPDVPLDANETFTGWDPAVTFGAVGPINETNTITVNAQIQTVYYVFFKDQNGKIVGTKTGANGDTISDFSDIAFPVAADESITGWKNADDEIVNSVTISGADITLMAEVKKGYWITFDSDGGSYIAPAFYASGETASAPTPPPTKQGYTFDGWYMDEDRTHTAIFNTITANTTVYAKWAPATASYTVIHWWENANDDGYSFYQSEQKSGTAGGWTNATSVSGVVSEKDITGNTVDDTVFIAPNTIAQEIIQGDGSTVVNVYYARKVYSLNFYEEVWVPGTGIWDWGHWEWQVTKQITKKWGADISKDEWPSYEGNNNWQLTGGSSSCVAFASTMPIMGRDLYATSGGNYTFTATYFTQNLDNELVYTEHHKDTIKRRDSVTRVGKQDRYPITGFELNLSRSTDVGAVYNGAEFYYDRISKYVVYYSNGIEEKRTSYKYGASISDAGNYVPPNPEGMVGYVFDGWYADPAGSEPYDFVEKTMPADDILVFAKWSPPVHTVTVFDSDGTTLLDTISNIPHGNTISADNMPTDDVTIPQDYQFLGWVNKVDDKPFSFDTLINKDYFLYAKVGGGATYTVVYNGNGATGDVPVDGNAYYAGAFAQVKASDGLTGPTDKPNFLGWSLSATETTTVYKPNDNLPISAYIDIANEDNEITLYAVWGPKPTTTTLTYYANYDGAESVFVQHMENGSTDLPNNETITLYGSDESFTRQGYELIGWAEAADAVEPDYSCGDSVMVDYNLEEGENNLYAVWERTTTNITVRKTVAGIEGDTPSFPFAASYMGSDGETTQTFEAFSLQNGLEQTLTNIPIGATLTLVESDAANYTTTATYGEDVDVTPENDGTRTITVTVNDTNDTIVVTNTIKTGSLTIQKNVTGLMGDKTKNFDFTYSYGEVNGTLSLADSESDTLENIPYGTEVTVTEADYTSSDYTTTYQGGNGEVVDGRVVTVTINSDSQTITFANNRDGTPDTGVLLDSLPYILILAVVVAIGAVAFIRKRGKINDD